jgi:transcriptional regulator of arginine metabolism
VADWNCPARRSKIIVMRIDQAILDIIARKPVGGQKALLAHLSRRGFVLTQSALSRRLHRLRVQKRDGQYVRLDSQAAALPPYRLSLAPPNLVVLHTSPGFAQAIALTIDQAKLPGCAGSVAGDDTVFVAVTDPAALTALRHAIDARMRGR